MEKKSHVLINKTGKKTIDEDYFREKAVWFLKIINGQIICSYPDAFDKLNNLKKRNEACNGNYTWLVTTLEAMLTDFYGKTDPYINPVAKDEAGATK